MRYSSQVKPISYLNANAAEVLTQLPERREPMVTKVSFPARRLILSSSHQ